MSWAWLAAYWAWAGSNIGALPLEAAVTAAAGYAFRRPIRRAWERMRAPLHAEMAEIRRIAEAARRISADTHWAVTGDEHPDAPERQG